MYAHERSLVEKLQGKPFALIGVNTDDSLAEIRRVVKEQRLNWRSFFDGDQGPIVNQYGVYAFPTVFLIDQQGIVREKWEGAPSAQTLDQAITDLLAETK